MSKVPVEEFTVSGGGDGYRSGTAITEGVPARRPWRGPLAWVSCAVVLVLIGVVLARPLNLGIEPWGEVPDVTSVPREAWTVGIEDELHAVLLADGVLITAGAQTVQGLEVGSGDQLWELAMVGARCTSDGQNLVCTDIASQVLQIDPHTGGSTALDVPQALVATVVDGDVYALIRGQQAQVQRRSDGEVVWSAPVSLGDGGGFSEEGLTVLGGHVITTLVMNPTDFGATGAVFDTATGERWGEPQLFVAQLSAGVWLAGNHDGGAVFLRGVDRPTEMAAAAGFLQYDDQSQSAEQVGNTAGDELGALDAKTGDWLWHTDYRAYPMARAGGVVVALAADGEERIAQGLRADTGELLWERSSVWLVCPCLSDGSTLASQAYEITTDASAELDDGAIVGLDLRSGEVLWRLPRPQQMVTMLSDGRHLVVASPWELSGWRLG